MSGSTDKDRFEDVKPADALGTLEGRSRASRVSFIIIVVISFFVLIFLTGLLVQSIRGGDNIPHVPKVDIG